MTVRMVVVVSVKIFKKCPKMFKFSGFLPKTGYMSGIYRENTMKKRILSQLEVKVFRACHHDFEGLSIEEAAEKMELSPDEVKLILKQVRRKAKQLFPILTPQHRAILLMYDKHMSRTSIAVALGISEQELHKEIAFLRKHKFLWNRKMDQYDSSMDGFVKERF